VAVSAERSLHEEVAVRLASLDQRYTAGRRAIVGVLEGAERPLTVPELLDQAGTSLPQSSAYRNLGVLVEAGVVHRIAGTDEHGRFELAEDLSGHHHHLLCSSCGTVADVSALPRLERALVEAAQTAADETGFEITGHRLDLVGRCADCR
jgi:Fur family transcriptional regulator, ferric uptake regulator